MTTDLERLDDEELFRLCRETDDAEAIRRAVSLLAARHGAALVRYLAGYTGSIEAAEDLCQEAFVRIYRHARAYKDIAKVRTWLYRIAQNLARNHARDERRRPRVSLEGATAPRDGDQGGRRELADPRAVDPSDEAALRERARRVRAAVDDLPEHYRSVVLLCDLEGLSYQDAADALETKIGTIRSRLFRARDLLSRAIEPLEASGPA